MKGGNSASENNGLVTRSRSGHGDRLATKIKNGTAVGKIVERDVLEAGEDCELIDVKGAAAIERQDVGATPAGQAIAGIQRRRRPVHRVIATSAVDRVGTRGELEGVWVRRACCICSAGVDDLLDGG